MAKYTKMSIPKTQLNTYISEGQLHVSNASYVFPNQKRDGLGEKQSFYIDLKF